MHAKRGLCFIIIAFAVGAAVKHGVFGVEETLCGFQLSTVFLSRILYILTTSGANHQFVSTIPSMGKVNPIFLIIKSGREWTV